MILYPRIIIEDGAAKLSFRISRSGGRIMVLKNLHDLISAEENREVLVLSKNESIDFSKNEFADSSKPLYEFILRCVGEVKDANDKISRRNSFRSVRKISVTSNLERFRKVQASEGSSASTGEARNFSTKRYHESITYI